MAEIPIVPPLNGLSDDLAFGDQPEGTTREAKNMRSIDPINGRMRIAQRSGTSRFNSNPIKTAGTKVSEILSITTDSKNITYSEKTDSEIESAGTEWSNTTPSKTSSLNGQADRQGNVYALDGNTGVVKYSTDGKLLWTMPLDAEDDAHVVRFLHVDDNDFVYAGVSAGGNQKTAMLWAYEQRPEDPDDPDPEDKFNLLWTLEPKAYIEDGLVFRDKLYTIQNEADSARAYIRIYAGIRTTVPRLVQEVLVAYPANSIAVKSDGSMFVASEVAGDQTTHYFRPANPKFPDFAPGVEDWTPRDIDDYEQRIWAWYVADDIDRSDVIGELEDGVGVARWRDRSGNNRHLFQQFNTGDEAPTYVSRGLNTHASVRFNGEDQGLGSLRNQSTKKQYADQQKSSLPGYEDSMFAMFIVCRPENSTNQATIFGQDRNQNSVDEVRHQLFSNTNDGLIHMLPPQQSPGSVYWFTGAAGVQNAHGVLSSVIDSGSYNNANSLALLTLHWTDGTVSGVSDDCLFRVNGDIVDKFDIGTADLNRSLERCWFGVFRDDAGGVPTPSGATYFNGDIVEIVVFDRKDRNDGSANVMTNDQIGPTDSSTNQTDVEMARVEAYLAYKYGFEGLLPSDSATWPHFYRITSTGSSAAIGGPPPDGSTGAYAKLLKRFGHVAKFTAQGELKWVANQDAVSTGADGGFGYAVAVNSDGNVYSLGPNATDGGAGTEQLRLIIDQGDTFSLSAGDGAWETTLNGAEIDYKYPRLAVDKHDNVYVPYFETNSAAATSLFVYKKDGTQLVDILLADSQQAHAVAVDPNIPDYDGDLTNELAEFVYLFTRNESDADITTVHKIALVSSVSVTGAPRTQTNIAVSGGDINKFTTASISTPTGGSGALDSSSQYIQGAILFTKIYFADGQQYKIYDAKEDLVEEWEAESAGNIPKRCKLIENWRGRIVLARAPGEPQNWFMSKKDDADNWDFFPPVPNENQAVAGNNTLAGLVPDIVNTLVPYSDDFLFFGGDRSIWQLAGDPAAGGRLDLLTDVTGMSFGRPWCKDPNGVLYFFGSRGGFYRLIPGRPPERLSMRRIERRLQDVNLASHYMRLCYNYRDEGIHVFQMPFGAGGTQVKHWFYDIKNDAFWEDEFSSTSVQPTAVYVLDGDAVGDRVLLLGCEDGRIRKWDEDADNDDGAQIDALVTLGPIMQRRFGNTQFSGLTVVLGNERDGGRYEYFAAEEPDSVGSPKRDGNLQPGRNPPKWDRVAGPYAWVRIRNSGVSERTSIERMSIHAHPAGGRVYTG